MYRTTRVGTGAAAVGASTRLPVTGSDLTVLVIVGVALIVVGFVLMRARLRGLAGQR